MSGWQEVYDHQLDIYRYWDSPEGVKYLSGFISDMERKGKLGETASHQENMERFGSPLISSIYQADPFYVSDEMMGVLEAARDSFVPEPLMPQDLITNYGFVEFPRSVWLRDVHDLAIAFRAVSWMPCRTPGRGDGIFLGIYSHRDDDKNGGYDYDSDQEFTLMHFFPWYFNEDLSDMPPEGMAVYHTCRDLQVFFRLTMQYVAQRDRMRPPRAARRRAEREEFPEKYVVVIRLRRPKVKHDRDVADVEWSHRWLVGGHWRNQWYPSLDAHRQIWISPYVKGPEDKELRLREGRAFELVR